MFVLAFLEGGVHCGGQRRACPFDRFFDREVVAFVQDRLDLIHEDPVLALHLSFLYYIFAAPAQELDLGRWLVVDHCFILGHLLLMDHETPLDLLLEAELAGHGNLSIHMEAFIEDSLT